MESDGTGVQSSIRPIFMPARANARNACCAPGRDRNFKVKNHGSNADSTANHEISLSIECGIRSIYEIDK